jgi:hypothetical protein
MQYAQGAHEKHGASIRGVYRGAALLLLTCDAVHVGCVGHLEWGLVTKCWYGHVPDAIYQHQHNLIGLLRRLHLARLLLLLLLLLLVLLGCQEEQSTCWVFYCFVLLLLLSSARHRLNRRKLFVTGFMSCELQGKGLALDACKAVLC